MNIATFNAAELGSTMLVGLSDYCNDAHDWTIKQALHDWDEIRLPPDRRYQMLWKVFRQKKFDTLILQYPIQTMAWYAAILCLIFRKKLVCDVFVPLYEMRVTDRGASKYSWFGIRAALLDWLTCWLAHVVIVDTKEHGHYLARFTHTSPKKYQVLYLQVKTDVFAKPGMAPPSDYYTVLFVGRFIPLQGIEYILQAQKIIEDKKLAVQLRLVGNGQTRQAMKTTAKDLQLERIVFRDECELSDVAEEIWRSNVCLGIFGKSPKTHRVIPHKVLEALAGNRPVITARTTAMLERFPAETTLLNYCPAADAATLAATIERLYSDWKSQ